MRNEASRSKIKNITVSSLYTNAIHFNLLATFNTSSDTHRKMLVACLYACVRFVL